MVEAIKKPVKVVKKKRRKKSKMYFGTPVQEAIIRYNESSNPVIKNRIYQEHIHAAFEKMAEKLIEIMDKNAPKKVEIKLPNIKKISLPKKQV